MAYSAIAVANAFIELAKREGNETTLTNMKLQKLVYIAQGFSLALLGKPLFNEDIRALKWGPVIMGLYNKVKQYGNSPIDKTIPLPVGTADIDIDDKLSAEAILINFVWNKYKNYTAAQLSSITHQQGTPWSEVWREDLYAVIPNDLIQSHYKTILKAA